MQDDRDYYEILGVHRDAQENEIRRAFRSLAKELHPDAKRAGDQAVSDFDFSMVTEAYETLKDPHRRAAYDQDLLYASELASQEQRRMPRFFVLGLVISLVFLSAFGAKIYLDHARSRTGEAKSQDSLRVGGPAERVPAAQDANLKQDSAAKPVQVQEPLPLQQKLTLAEKSPPATRADVGQSAGRLPPEPQTAAASPSSETPSPNPDSTPRDEQQVPIGKGAETGAAKPAPAPTQDAADHRPEGVNGLAGQGSPGVSPPAGEVASGDANAKREKEVMNEPAPPAQVQDAPPQANGNASGSASGHFIEVATGLKGREATVRLRPGNGLNESFADCENCPEMVLIPGGKAMIGSRPENIDYRPEEAPAHKINFRKPFAVSKFRVSAENWRACVDAGACRPTLSSFLAIGRHVPATRVSWFDAKDYVQWLSQLTGHPYRLLTEAEWEYADLAPGRYPAGTLRGFGSREEKPGPFGLFRFGEGFRPGASRANAWGLHGMPGNVAEWVEDCWHGNYAGAPPDGSAWLSAGGGDCGYRVVRGGGGGAFGGRHRTARAREFADARSPTLGFRVARDVPEAAQPASNVSAQRGRSAATGE